MIGLERSIIFAILKPPVGHLLPSVQRIATVKTIPRKNTQTLVFHSITPKIDCSHILVSTSASHIVSKITPHFCCRAVFGFAQDMKKRSPSTRRTHFLLREDIRKIDVMQINTYDRDQISSQATCSSWLICKRYGLATPNLPLEKLRDDISSGEPVQIRAALHEIRQAANLTCSQIDRGLEPVKETVPLKNTSEPVR